VVVDGGLDLVNLRARLDQLHDRVIAHLDLALPGGGRHGGDDTAESGRTPPGPPASSIHAVFA
jgi:hypothetical protein